MGYKDDKAEFEKLFEGDLSEAERIKLINKVNPFFFKHKLDDLAELEDREKIEDNKFVLTALKRMKPLFIEEYIVDDDAFYTPRILALTLENEILDDPALYDIILEHPSLDASIREPIIKAITDKEILYELALDDSGAMALDAYKRLDKDIKDNHIKRIKNPLVLYKMLHDDKVKDQQEAINRLMILAKDDPNLIENSFDLFKYSKDNKKQTEWLIGKLGRYGDPVDKKILELLPVSIIKSEIPSHLQSTTNEIGSNSIQYVLDKVDNFDFTLEMAKTYIGNHDSFITLVPYIEDKEDKHLEELYDVSDTSYSWTNKDKKKFILNYMKPETLERLLTSVEEGSSVTNHMIEQYLEKTDNPNQEILANLALHPKLSIWHIVIDHITDPKLLKEIAKTKTADESLVQEAFKGWLEFGNIASENNEDINFIIKYIEKNPKIIKKAKGFRSTNLPDKIKEAIITNTPRSFDEPTGNRRLEPIEDKVPSHKQQLLRLLLTVAKPAA